MHWHRFLGRGANMTRRPLQFGLSSLMWLVAFAAANCWLFSLGAWGGILAVVIDKHVLVAYLCMKADVDRRARKTIVAENRRLLADTDSDPRHPSPLRPSPLAARGEGKGVRGAVGIGEKSRKMGPIPFAGTAHRMVRS